MSAGIALAAILVSIAAAALLVLAEIRRLRTEVVAAMTALHRRASQHAATLTVRVNKEDAEKALVGIEDRLRSIQSQIETLDDARKQAGQ